MGRNIGKIFRLVKRKSEEKSELWPCERRDVVPLAKPRAYSGLERAQKLGEGGMRVFWAAVLLCLAALPAAAMTKNGAYMVHGPGASSCGTWTKDRRENNWYSDSGWVLGFVSAFNRFSWSVTPDVAQSTDSDGINAWVDRYCELHPTSQISDATARLVTVLTVRAMGGQPTDEFEERK
jgi:hypothetical protein